MTAPARSDSWNGLLRIVPTAILIAVVWWFSRRVDWDQWRALISDADWLLYSGLVALQIVTLLLAAWLWYRPLSRELHDPEAPPTETRAALFLALFRIQMASGLVESLTPSSKLGGEAVKLVLLRRRTGLSRDRLLYLMILNKTVTFAPFAVLTAALLIYSAGRWAVPAGATWALISLVALFATILALLHRYGSRWGRVQWRSDRLPLFAVSAIMWALYPIKFALVGRMLGLSIPFALVAVAVCAAYVVSILPITPGGLGSFEATFALIVSQAGLDLDTGVLLALATRLVTFWFPLMVATVMSVGLFGVVRSGAGAASCEAKLRKGLWAVFQIERICARLPRLARAYHTRFYQTMVEREIQQCNLQPGDRVAHIGSGPFPMTALRLAHHGIHCDGFDIDPDAIRSSREYIETVPNLPGRIRILDASTELPRDVTGWSRYRAVFFSLHVTGKAELLTSVCGSLTNGSTVVYRNPRSLLRRLYPDCLPKLPTEWNRYRISQPFLKESVVLSRRDLTDSPDTVTVK